MFINWQISLFTKLRIYSKTLHKTSSKKFSHTSRQQQKKSLIKSIFIYEQIQLIIYVVQHARQKKSFPSQIHKIYCINKINFTIQHAIPFSELHNFNVLDSRFNVACTIIPIYFCDKTKSFPIEKSEEWNPKTESEIRADRIDVEIYGHFINV